VIGTDAGTCCEYQVWPDHVHVCLTGAGDTRTMEILDDALETAALVNPLLPVVVDLSGLRRVTPDALARIQLVTDRAMAHGAQVAIRGPAPAAVACAVGARTGQAL
jgi:hypothetical protein